MRESEKGFSNSCFWEGSEKQGGGYALQLFYDDRSYAPRLVGPDLDPHRREDFDTLPQWKTFQQKLLDRELIPVHRRGLVGRLLDHLEVPNIT